MKVSGGVELDQGLWPQRSFGEVPVHRISDALVPDDEEAPDVLFVVADQIVTQAEDVHDSAALRRLSKLLVNPTPFPIRLLHAFVESTVSPQETKILRGHLLCVFWVFH